MKDELFTMTPEMPAMSPELLARGGPFERLEGEWQPKRLVILEFPSLAEAKRWHGSEEYRPAKALRQKLAVSDVIVVDGA